jgi:hypothetical protein
MKQEHKNDFAPVVQDQLDELIGLIVDHVRKTSSDINLAQITENVKLILAHQQRFERGTSDAANFMDINQIEQMMLDLRKEQNDLNFMILLEKMKNMKAESEIVAQKKTSTDRKG